MLLDYFLALSLRSVKQEAANGGDGGQHRRDDQKP